MSASALATVAAKTGAVVLPNNPGWSNRLEIKSASSPRKYVVAQRNTDGVWGCSCMGWIRYRHCKHLDAMLPVLKATFQPASEATKAAEKHARIGGR